MVTSGMPQRAAFHHYVGDSLTGLQGVCEGGVGEVVFSRD